MPKDLLKREDLLCVFGCAHFEEEILGVINQDLVLGRFPNFKIYNLEETNCGCKTDSCCWNETQIVKRLKECGVWKKIETLLSNDNSNLHARQNDDGSISVDTYEEA